jgi:segregation and condensation protein A
VVLWPVFWYNCTGTNMEEFNVTIDKFDGPLDLMLHLIKENQLDLMDLISMCLPINILHTCRAWNSLHLESGIGVFS